MKAYVVLDEDYESGADGQINSTFRVVRVFIGKNAKKRVEKYVNNNSNSWTNLSVSEEVLVDSE